MKEVSYDTQNLPARIWLYVAQEGWVNFHEVATDLALPPKRTKEAMLQMARQGQLARRGLEEAPEDAPTKLQFGVIQTCKLPTGLRLDMILRAVGVQ